MMKPAFAFILFLSGFIMQAQPTTWDKDIEEIERVTNEMLDIISGVPGDEYDWETFRGHFMANGNLSAIFPDTANGYLVYQGMIDTWLERAAPYYENKVFFEEAIDTEVLTTGRIATVWQHFRIYDEEGNTLDEGINAYHMIKEDSKWKVAHLMWDTDREE